MKSVFFSYFFPSLHVLFGTETATMISYQFKFLYVEYTLPLVRKERRQSRSKKKEKCNALSSTLQKAAPSLSPHFSVSLLSESASFWGPFPCVSHAEKGEHWWFQTCIPGLLIHKKRRLVSSWSHLWKSSKRSLIGCAWWSLTQSPCPTKSSAEIVLYWMECPTLFVCGAGGGVGQRTGRGPTTDSSVKII